jgi:hypothetical protein
MEINYATHRLNREDSNRTQLTDPPCVYNALPTMLRTNTKLGEVEEMESGTSKQKHVGHNEDNQQQPKRQTKMTRSEKPMMSAKEQSVVTTRSSMTKSGRT